MMLSMAVDTTEYNCEINARLINRLTDIVRRITNRPVEPMDETVATVSAWGVVKQD